MGLDDRERSSCVKEAEVSSSSPFIRTGEKFWLCLREMTACFVVIQQFNIIKNLDIESHQR